MQKDAATVNAGKRISRMEARREKLLITIERTQRRFEKADKTARRALKSLATLERTRRRMDKALAKARTEAADDTVESATPKLEAMEQALGEAIYGERPRGMARLAHLAEDLPNAALEAGQDQGIFPKADDGLPNFLRRQQERQAEAEHSVEERHRKLQAMADPKTKEKKAERRAVEKEIRQAEITGKRRKMPLTGRAALAAMSAENQQTQDAFFGKRPKKT